MKLYSFYLKQLPISKRTWIRAYLSIKVLFYRFIPFKMEPKNKVKVTSFILNPIKHGPGQICPWTVVTWPSGTWIPIFERVKHYIIFSLLIRYLPTLLNRVLLFCDFVLKENIITNTINKVSSTLHLSIIYSHIVFVYRNNISEVSVE